MRVSFKSYLFILVAVLPLTGCLFRTHEVQKSVSTASLRSSTLEQLEQAVNGNAERLQSVLANIDIDTSVSRQKKGKANEYKVTDYKEISGYLLIRKPEMLRMWGLVPVVRNRLFDMVSNGKTFQLSVPPTNKFYVGANQMSRPSANPLENLRPQHILDALLLKPIDPQTEIAVLEQGTEMVKDEKSHKDLEQADYEVVVVHHEENVWYLSRKIIFSRTDLLPHRQLIYNRMGQVITDAEYAKFTNDNGILFPALVQIQRPIENYWIQISITKLRLNQPLKDDQFALNQPPGSQLINMDQKNANANALTGQAGVTEEKPKTEH
jgi:outer membrane lipoprotein-sorting protein